MKKKLEKSMKMRIYGSKKTDIGSLYIKEFGINNLKNKVCDL